jgi:hypothetical protein
VIAEAALMLLLASIVAEALLACAEAADVLVLLAAGMLLLACVEVTDASVLLAAGVLLLALIEVTDVPLGWSVGHGAHLLSGPPASQRNAQRSSVATTVPAAGNY